MRQRMMRLLSKVKMSVMTGNADDALRLIEELSDFVARHGVPAGDLELLENSVSELRLLAEASARGTKQAIEQVTAILQAARSLQTYDEAGKKQSTITVAPVPQRF